MGHHPSQNVGLRSAVGVDHEDDLALQQRDRVVERHRLALVVLLGQQPDTAAIHQRRQDLAGAIGRAVVDDHHLVLGPVEAQEAIDGLADHRLLVVSGDEHGDEWVLGELIEGVVCALAMEGVHDARLDPEERGDDGVQRDEQHRGLIRRVVDEPLKDGLHAAARRPTRREDSSSSAQPKV